MKANRKEIIRSIARLRADGMPWIKIAEQVKVNWPGMDLQHVSWAAQALYNSKSARKLCEDERFFQTAGCVITTQLDTAGNVVGCSSRVVYADEI